MTNGIASHCSAMDGQQAPINWKCCQSVSVQHYSLGQDWGNYPPDIYSSVGGADTDKPFWQPQLTVCSSPAACSFMIFAQF